MWARAPENRRMGDDVPTPVLTRASLTWRPSTSATVLPKGKGRTKKRKYQKSSSNLTAPGSSDAISDLSRIWMAGDKALLVQQGFDNASTLASAEQSIAGLLLSEEVATVSAAVASVGIFWVLLGTALCFVVRIRRQKHQRQRRRSRANAAQTAMLDEMIRSELARGRTRPHCDGSECWTPTYANVPRHLVECGTVHATDSADAENLYWSIPATISIQASNSSRGAVKRSPETNTERTDQHRNCPQNPDRIVVRTTSRKPRQKSTHERRTTTDRCSDHTRTCPQTEDGSGKGKNKVPGKDSSIAATNVQPTQRSPALNAASRRGHACDGVAGRECRLHQRRQDPDAFQKKTELGLVIPIRHENDCMKIAESSSGSFVRNQFCLVSSSNSNSNSNSNYCCSDVTNFQCRHHIRERERETTAACNILSCRSCVGLVGTDRGDVSAKNFNSFAPGNGCRSAAAPGCSQPQCLGIVPGTRALTNKPPVRFPKMGRSCLVMGELIRRDWIWKLGGGQPLGSVSICERRDHRPTSRDPEIPLHNI